jgi:hypothetical protein
LLACGPIYSGQRSSLDLGSSESWEQWERLVSSSNGGTANGDKGVGAVVEISMHSIAAIRALSPKTGLSGFGPLIDIDGSRVLSVHVESLAFALGPVGHLKLEPRQLSLGARGYQAESNAAGYREQIMPWRRQRDVE